jgi:hypothetical protein
MSADGSSLTEQSGLTGIRLPHVNSLPSGETMRTRNQAVVSLERISVCQMLLAESTSSMPYSAEPAARHRDDQASVGLLP